MTAAHPTGSPAATSTALDFVPGLRNDFVRRDIAGESVVWSPVAPQPAVLDPVATVMLDVIDGVASTGELAVDVHETIGVPLETAQRQVIRVVEQLGSAGLLTSSTGTSTPEAAIEQAEIFVSGPTSCSENSSRIGTVTINLRLADDVVRIACDSKRAARTLQNALADHIVDDVEDVPLAFVLTAPQGLKRRHLLVDRTGFELSAGHGLEPGLHALACHLTALLPPRPGTVRIRARALVAGDRTIMCLPPLLYFPPIEERDLTRAGLRVIDRLALDIDVETGRIVHPEIPWPALAELRSARSHLGTGGERAVDVVIEAAVWGAAPQTPAGMLARLAENGVHGSRVDLLDAAARVVEGAEVRSSPPVTDAVLEVVLQPTAPRR